MFRVRDMPRARGIRAPGHRDNAFIGEVMTVAVEARQAIALS